jgi:hypothetical protein
MAPDPAPWNKRATTPGETATQSGEHGIGMLPSRQDAPAGASKRTRQRGSDGSGVGVGVGVASGVGDGVGDGFGYETSEILRYHQPECLIEFAPYSIPATTGLPSFQNALVD